MHPHSASEADQTVHRVRGGPVNLYLSPFAEPAARGGLIRGLSLACTGGSRGRGVPRGGATPAPGGPAPRGVRGHRGLRCHRRDAGTWHHAHVYALTMFGDSEVGPCRGHATASGHPRPGVACLCPHLRNCGPELAVQGPGEEHGGWPSSSWTPGRRASPGSWKSGL